MMKRKRPWFKFRQQEDRRASSREESPLSCFVLTVSNITNCEGEEAELVARLLQGWRSQHAAGLLHLLLAWHLLPSREQEHGNPPAFSPQWPETLVAVTVFVTQSEAK